LTISFVLEMTAHNRQKTLYGCQQHLRRCSKVKKTRSLCCRREPPRDVGHLYISLASNSRGNAVNRNNTIGKHGKVVQNTSVTVRVDSYLWPPYEIGRPLYFCPVVTIFLSIFFSLPNLSGRRFDVYHTSTQCVALVRI